MVSIYKGDLAATEYAGRLQLHPFPARWGPPPADVEQRARWILT